MESAPNIAPIKGSPCCTAAYTKNRPLPWRRGAGFILLFQRVDNAVPIVLVLADDLNGVAVIQTHHAPDALGIGNAALHIVNTDIVIALGGSRHDPLYLSKIGNLDLFHHHNDLQT